MCVLFVCFGCLFVCWVACCFFLCVFVDLFVFCLVGYLVGYLVFLLLFVCFGCLRRGMIAEIRLLGKWGRARREKRKKEGKENTHIIRGRHRQAVTTRHARTHARLNGYFVVRFRGIWCQVDGRLQEQRTTVCAYVCTANERSSHREKGLGLRLGCFHFCFALFVFICFLGWLYVGFFFCSSMTTETFFDSFFVCVVSCMLVCFFFFSTAETFFHS